jgi:monoamine oxidase
VLAACGSSSEPKGGVVVVGAGLAGLSAADELVRRGWAVVVLEARGRVGGRVKTVRNPATGQYAEGGGEFLDSEHSEMRALVDRFGLALEPASVAAERAEDLVVRGGRRRSYASIADADARRQMNRYYDAVDELAAGFDPADPARQPGASALDQTTAAATMDELGISGDGRYLLEAEIRDDYGVEPDRLSQLFVVSTWAAAYNQPDSGIEIERVEGGAEQVPMGLAEELGDAVRLGKPVTEVQHTKRGVIVRAGDGEVFQGEHCVLAAPLPALRGISFSPALPRKLADAVGQAQYAPISKVLLQYPRRFWADEGLSGYALTDSPAGTTWEATVAQPGETGVLVSYAAGALGEAQLGLSTGEVVRSVSSGVVDAFPGRVPTASVAQPLRWPLKRYSGGAYVAWAPGQLSTWYAALRRGVGRLHFAGEHTAELSGYMEGAVRSGLRVAEEIDTT